MEDCEIEETYQGDEMEEGIGEHSAHTKGDKCLQQVVKSWLVHEGHHDDAKYREETDDHDGQHTIAVG